MFNWLRNLALFVTTLLLLALVVEKLVFGVLYLPSDLPVLQENNGGVLRYESGQEGVYRIKDEIAGRFSINNEGWNSSVDYFPNKESDLPRICLIGDSMIEALQVSVESHMARVLEKELSGEVDSVYSFALSGGPLSHYVYLLEHEVVRFNPDIVVIHLASSDLIESVYPSVGAYPTSLARLRYQSTKESRFSHIDPSPYQRDPISRIKSTNAYRYLRVREQLRLDWIKTVLLELFLREKNIGIDRVKEPSKAPDSEELTRGIAEVLMKKAVEVSRKGSFRLIFLVDGNRPEIYEAVDSGSVELPEASDLARTAAEIGSDLGIEVLMLDRPFFEHYLKTRTKVNFELDLHWNEKGHQIAATVLAKHIARNGQRDYSD